MERKVKGENTITIIRKNNIYNKTTQHSLKRVWVVDYDVKKMKKSNNI